MTGVLKPLDLRALYIFLCIKVALVTEYNHRPEVKDRYREYMREYRQANSEKLREYMREYRKRKAAEA